MKNYKTKKGVFYFESFGDAFQYTFDHGHPTDRIIQYDLGFAIQLKVSGPYVGKDSEHDVSGQN